MRLSNGKFRDSSKSEAYLKFFHQSRVASSKMTCHNAQHGSPSHPINTSLSIIFITFGGEEQLHLQTKTSQRKVLILQFGREQLRCEIQTVGHFFSWLYTCRILTSLFISAAALINEWQLGSSSCHLYCRGHLGTGKAWKHK